MKSGLEDLSARSRRGELSEAEQKQLRVALDASVEARMAHRAGLEFDAEDSVLAGDEALAQRVSERLLTTHPTVKPIARRSGRRIWRFAAAGVCLTVAAAAGTPVARNATELIRELTWGSSSSPSRAVPPEPAPAPPAPAKAAPAVLPDPPAEPEAEPETESAETSAPKERRVQRRKAKPSVETEESGAATAFREASRLRREGRAAEAIQQYAALLKRYPSSPEARASEIALGMLHLGAGSPASGLRYFDRYLSTNPGGQLAADALWGKTRALAAMGRNEEARRGLELLIDRYPRSTYATAARAKLGISP